MTRAKFSCDAVREMPRDELAQIAYECLVKRNQAIRALDLRKERIRLLQEALCECQHRDFFQADLHDETCPVYVIAEEQKREYEPRA